MTFEPSLALAAIGRTVADASAVGAAIGLAAIALRRPLRALPAKLQAWLWWLVAGRLLLQLFGAPAVDLAWLPAATEGSARFGTRIEESAPLASLLRDDLPADPLDLGARRVPPEPRFDGQPASPPPSTRRRIDPWMPIGALWLFGVCGVALKQGVALLRRRRMLRGAEQVVESEVAVELERARRLAGVERPVALCSSSSVCTPLVAGVLRPAIVLPAGARLSAEELRLALVHELVHVRRRDAVRALVPALARMLFYFHPVAWLARREFALATEAACDAEVVRVCGARAESYGALLLRFALPPQLAARFAATWPLGGRVIQRRLDMLIARHHRPRHFLLASAATLLAALALVTPVRLVAADESATPAAAAEPAAPPPAAPAGREVGERWTAKAPEPPSSVSVPLLPSAPPALRAPAAATVPLPPAAPRLLPPTPRASLAPVGAVAPLAPEPPDVDLPRTTPFALLAPLGPLPPPVPAAAPELRGADWLLLADRDAHLSIDAPRWARRRADDLAEREGRPVVLLGRGSQTFVVRDTETIDALRRLFFEEAEAARSAAQTARDSVRQAMERSRQAMAATRQALMVGQRDLLNVAAELERTARRQAERVEALGSELEKRSVDGIESVVERAKDATRALEALEVEVARVREEAGRRRAEADAARQQAIDESRVQLEARRTDMERQMSDRRRQLERELERRLDEIFEMGLAEPLAQ